MYVSMVNETTNVQLVNRGRSDVCIFVSCKYQYKENFFEWKRKPHLNGCSIRLDMPMFFCLKASRMGLY